MFSTYVYSRSHFWRSHRWADWLLTLHCYCCCCLIHTYIQRIVLATKEKLRRHNKSAIYRYYLSNADPACGRKEVRRTTGHIMVTTRYSEQQGGSKSRQNVMRLYKQWHRPINVKMVHQTSLRHIESNLDRLGLLSPTHDWRSQQQNGQIMTVQSVLINKSKFLKGTHRTKIRKIEIPKSMVVEALSW